MNSLLVARGYGILRGLIGIVFVAMLIAVPEQMMPGSSAEPARSLALVFASRQILLAVAFLTLAVRDRRIGLSWVFLGDAALQAFDTAMAVAKGDGAIAILPLAFGVLDVWAARILQRRAEPT